MPYRKYGAFTSSVDPNELSLTVTSTAKVIIGLIGTYAAYKGLDTQVITTQLQAIIAIVVTLIPIGFTTWHTLQLAWGAFRKPIVAFAAKPNPSNAAGQALSPQ